MKGLILKEFYLSLRIRAICLLSYFILLILCILVKISSVYGNVADMNGKDMFLGTIFYLMALALPAVLGISSLSCHVLEDEKSRFKHFSRSLPLTSRQIVGSLYIHNLLSLGAATVCGWLTYFLACGVFSRSIEPRYLLYILIINAILFTFYCSKIYLNYRFQSRKVSTAILAVLIIVLSFGLEFGMLGLMNYYFKKRGYDMFSDNEDKKTPPDSLTAEFASDFARNLGWVGAHFWWAFMLVGGAVILLSYLRSVHEFERRS